MTLQIYENGELRDMTPEEEAEYEATMPKTDVVAVNITSAPDNLTGGPTLAEVFNVHE